MTMTTRLGATLSRRSINGKTVVVLSSSERYSQLILYDAESSLVTVGAIGNVNNADQCRVYSMAAAFEGVGLARSLHIEQLKKIPLAP